MKSGSKLIFLLIIYCFLFSCKKDSEPGDPVVTVDVKLDSVVGKSSFGGTYYRIIFEPVGNQRRIKEVEYSDPLFGFFGTKHIYSYSSPSSLEPLSLLEESFFDTASISFGFLPVGGGTKMVGYSGETDFLGPLIEISSEFNYSGAGQLKDRGDFLASPPGSTKHQSGNVDFLSMDGNLVTMTSYQDDLAFTKMFLGAPPSYEPLFAGRIESTYDQGINPLKNIPLLLSTPALLYSSFSENNRLSYEEYDMNDSLIIQISNNVVLDSLMRPTVMVEGSDTLHFYYVN